METGRWLACFQGGAGGKEAEPVRCCAALCCVVQFMSGWDPWISWLFLSAQLQRRMSFSHGVSSVAQSNPAVCILARATMQFRFLECEVRWLFVWRGIVILK